MMYVSPTRTVQATTMEKAMIGMFTRQNSSGPTLVFSFISTLRHMIPVSDALIDMPNAP
jgi:hypothetical protein